MKHTRSQTRFIVVANVLAALLVAAGTAVFADGARVGSTTFPRPIDGGTRRFPAVAYDGANNAYLVVWGIGQIGARFVSASGAPLGSPVAINTTAGAGVRVACGAQLNACLVTWVQEPFTIVGRLIRYNGGAVQAITSPFVVNQNGMHKLSSAAPGVTFSAAANEFLVAWTEFSPGNNIKAQRIGPSGARVGGEIAVATTSLWEGFPSLAYNSTQNEYMVIYYYETSGGTNAVGAQRVRPGTGALIGGRNTLASSSFDQYPEVAYNSQANQYLAITWGFSGNSWMLRGRRADGNAATLGSSSLALAVGGGGDGIGLAYNPVSNTYLAVYLSQNNAEIWGVEVGSNGVPTPQFQMTVSGTTLATQPQAAGSTATGRWLTVASEGYRRIMGQLAGHTTGSTAPPPPSTPTSSCTTVKPGPDWTCVNGGWLPPTTSGGSTSSCTTPSPGSGWTCVSGNWLPPTTSGGGGSTSSCTTVRPASNWTCVNGNWLPPTTGGSTGGSGSCTTASPGSGWTCVSGNWLPPTTGGGGSTSSCTTVRPASNWTCVNGNWLPPTTGGSTGSTSSCTSVQPASNWVCVSGNWLPPTMSCTTVSPGAGWTCVSGNWLPPTTTTTSASSCPTVKPGTGWTCVGGNWLPPGY